MNTFLAYALVIILTRLAMVVGGMATALVLSVVTLAGLPFPSLRSKRIPIEATGVISGVGSVATAVIAGYYVFGAIVGPNAYGFFPFLASIIAFPLIIVMVRMKLPDELDNFEDFEHIRTVRFLTIGIMIGIPLAFAWYLLFYRK